jgi:hypothetical protein
MAKDQMNVRVSPELRAQVMALAQVRGEHDNIGRGASAIARRLFTQYVDEHRAELPDWWRDLVDARDVA